MTASADPSLVARMRALRDSAIRAEEPSLPFRISLRRALHSGGLPMALNLGVGGNAEQALIGQGWGDPTESGRWTLGPLAQLLIVTGSPLAGEVALTIDIARAFVVERHPLQSVELHVNGTALGSRQFAHDMPIQDSWPIVVPAAVVERLGALLIDLRLSSPAQPLELGIAADFRVLGIMVRSLHVAAASATDSLRPIRT